MFDSQLRSELLEKYEYRDGWLYYSNRPSNRSRAGTLAGSINQKGYWRVMVGGKSLQAHRAIFLMLKGWLPEILDHIDGNKINNSIDNLRPATPSQNQFNRSGKGVNRSGRLGVAWHAQARKWQVQVKAAGKTVYGGLFADLDMADAAAKKLRSELHGEYVRASA